MLVPAKRQSVQALKREHRERTVYRDVHSSFFEKVEKIGIPA